MTSIECVDCGHSWTVHSDERNSLEAQLAALRAAAQSRDAAHVPEIGRRVDGTWGSYCRACSSPERGYVWPCDEGCDMPPDRLVAAAERDKLRAEIERLKDETFPATWGGLIEFLDSRYPSDVFGASADPGPQIVALTRELAAERTKVAAVRELHFERKGICWSCPSYDWPCPTAAALDAEAVTDR